MNELGDTQLVHACLEGDMEAFAMLVERHRNAVYNLAYRLCGNAATAEDVAQEVFIRAYRRLDQYRSRFPFRNWVLGICANLTRSRYRHRKRQQELEQAYVREEVLSREEQRGAERRNQPEQAALERALSALPHTLRAPLILKYMEDMSVEEIATTLGLRLSAAKMRLARGRDKLSAWIAVEIQQGAVP